MACEMASQIVRLASSKLIRSVQPAARVWPPPPNCTAMALTSSPLERMLTRQMPSSFVLSTTAMSTPSMTRIMPMKDSVDFMRAVVSALRKMPAAWPSAKSSARSMASPMSRTVWYGFCSSASEMTFGSTPWSKSSAAARIVCDVVFEKRKKPESVARPV